jgi:hypothetical protein
MNVYICFMWSYTLTPPLFSTMVSHWQTTALAIPYDNHVMYAFTYADIPSLSESQCHSHVDVRIYLWIICRVHYNVDVAAQKC